MLIRPRSWVRHLGTLDRLENAQAMAAHESPRTTNLYDRTGDEITRDGWSGFRFRRCFLAPAPTVLGLPAKTFCVRPRATDKGASIAARPLPLISARMAVCTTATFSAVMRLYSAGEQVP